MEYSVKYKPERTSGFYHLTSGHSLKGACEEAKVYKKAHGQFQFFVMKGDEVIAEIK
tara:strand:- start:17304 stop:17474 length:171 start_codon:yes stop_codon:yes gene_type:complete